ncbi:MAG: MarR family transcriptional regulator [Verrucomicrobia bacterium]|nr:MarR family transcriptional regulator [Verrucomicrobiota bacterium]
MNVTLPSASPAYQALIQLLRTADIIWNSGRVLFARWDLSPSQFNVLNLLYELPKGLSQTDLSRALLMHRSNLTGLVDRLEERRLVKRHETPGDRRSYQVVISGPGLRLMTEILPIYYQAAEGVWGDIDPGQASQLKTTLSRICANVERMEADFRRRSAANLANPAELELPGSSPRAPRRNKSKW